MKNYKSYLAVLSFILLTTLSSFAQNPFITDQFSADPSARVFGNKVYVYPSHDILATEGKGRIGWFCMEDYHVFSSSNLTDWTDHGLIVTQDKVPWVRPGSYSMWAPDCIERNGKYYFYFPSAPKDTVMYGRGFAIGVAVADNPEGPFVPEETPINNVHGIDPNVFIDKDGQAYLYWSAGNIYAAKLKANMLELASEPVTLKDLPSKGLKEGPYLFERNGIYYLTYPHVENKTERLEYATGDNPLGPFHVTGVIMDESPTGCWTNHQSVINFNNQWFLFYHHNDFSPGFDKARSVRIDSLFFLPDGAIKKVTPSFRGVGLSDARKPIQVDRFSAISNKAVFVSSVDTADRFKGWKTTFESTEAWIQYNSVDFGNTTFKKVQVNARSAEGGMLELHTQSITGPVIAQIKITAGKEWQLAESRLLTPVKGIQNLFITSMTNKKVDADWVKFE